MRDRLRDWLPTRWRIAPILTVTMILLTVSFIVTTTLLDISRARRIYREELRTRGWNLAGQMNDLLADPLYLSNVEDVEKVATLVASQTDIEYVRVFTTDGVILTDTSLSGFQSLGAEAPALGMRALGEERGIEESNGDLIEIAQPVTIGGQPIGGVQIGLRSDVLQKQVRGIIVEHLIQGGILIVIAGGIAYLIARASPGRSGRSSPRPTACPPASSIPGSGTSRAASSRSSHGRSTPWPPSFRRRSPISRTPAGASSASRRACAGRSRRTCMAAFRPGCSSCGPSSTGRCGVGPSVPIPRRKQKNSSRRSSASSTT
ncbi:MAG: hypothetical protein R2849_07810 [Thermomicrobiales bacterium]